MKKLVLLPLAASLSTHALAAPSSGAKKVSHASSVATTGAKVRPKSGVLSPQVSISPGEAMTLTSTRFVPTWRAQNILRPTLPASVRTPLAQTLLAQTPQSPVIYPAARLTLAPASGAETGVTVKVIGFSHDVPASAVPKTASESVPKNPVIVPQVVPTDVPVKVSEKTLVKVEPPKSKPLKTAPTKIAALPQTVERTTPATLSSRYKDRILLAQLDAELRRSESRLNRADDDLEQSRHQLTKFTDTLRQAMLEAGPDAKGLHPFVKVAQTYAGTPYVWGGESRNGFDCSGFIIRVMRDLGYHALPHSAAEQFTYGKPIAQALLKPGDLVFFANTYKPGISHVGIYLGKRRFIHAAGTGIGTIVSSLDSAKFQAKYAGARRLVAGG